MRITPTQAPVQNCPTDMLVLPVYRTDIPEVTREVGALLGLDLAAIVRRFQLTEVGDSCWVPTESSATTPTSTTSTHAGFGDLLLVDIGSGPFVSPSDLRQAAMRAARQLRRERVTCALGAVPLEHSSTTGHAPRPDAAAILSETLTIGTYSFARYRTRENDDLRVREIVLPDASEESARVGAIIGECTNYARDLVNTPGADLTPEAFAELCQADGARHGFECRVLRREELLAGHFGGIVGVGAGSVHPPVLIELSSDGVAPDAAPATALVGKGITFDSGGLDVKDVSSMVMMKNDMAGAASILATFIAARRLNIGQPLRGYLACAENMPDGRALRPGDVLRHRNGLTTEVISPDAEGRLVLADALARAAESEPHQIIDIATLTGSTSLGPELWGILGTSNDLIDSLLNAGERAGEPGWELPLWDGYVSSIRSEIADLKNYQMGLTWGYGAIMGALFLREFISEVPWAHLDIGATALRDKPDDCWPAGATGSATRTLIYYLTEPTSLAAPART